MITEHVELPVIAGRPAVVEGVIPPAEGDVTSRRAVRAHPRGTNTLREGRN
jgi:hypothetical protein